MRNRGTRYRYIGDEPLENAGSAGAGNAGAASAQAGTTAAAKTRSRPNSEYVLYSNGEPVAVNSDNGVSYFGTDILGSVRSVTDRNGQVKASYEYDAFGTPYLSNLENDVGFGYTGKIFDSATGLYDYGFRDYSPNSARFTTIDPVRDGNNWFSYVVNDPVNYIDPFGLTATDAGRITFSSNLLNNSNIGFQQPKIAIDSSMLSTSLFNGIDTKNSIMVACDSNSTIGRCLSPANSNVLSFGNENILGSKDVYIGGQNSESQSSQLLRQGAIEMLLGGILDNGAPFIGGALASVTGGSGVLTIPLIKAFGITLQIDGAAKIAQGTVLAATEGSGSSTDAIERKYRSNTKHHPNAKGKASVEPKNAEEMFNNSVEDPKRANTRWYRDKNGTFHRFQGSNNEYHWNGSTETGTRLEDVPIEIRRSMPLGDI